VKRLVLAGAGHAHALVLRAMAQRRPTAVEVVVVSPEPLAPYSGMVPGWLAGLYTYGDIAVDFPPLARAAGAHWRQGEVQALDPARRRVFLQDGDALDYDLLSLNLGSTLRPPAARHAQMLPLRPLSALHTRVQALLAAWQADRGEQPFVVTAVGGGAAGFEALLALLQRLRQLRPDRVVQGGWLVRGTSVLPGLAPAARRAALRALDRAGVTVQLGSSWCDAVDRSSDVVLWATGAQAHDWQLDPSRRGALAVDDDGFVAIDIHLRSVSHPQIFATGDCASWPGRPLPKAGVHAVRMGPVLTHNLLTACSAGGTFQRHRPQRHFLTLLATGDRRAIAARGRFGAEGAWAWAWKDRIDRRFLARLRASPGVDAPADNAPLVADPVATRTGETT